MAWSRGLVSLAAGFCLHCAGPAGDASECTVGRAAEPLMGGVESTGFLGMSATQMDAVGRLEINDDAGDLINLCTALRVAPAWALTARHCLSGALGGSLVLRFGGAESMSAEPGAAILHDERDLALLPIAVAPRGVAGQGTIGWASSDVVRSGARVEIGGFGIRADGNLGERQFAVAQVESVDERYIRLGTVIQAAACGGDSGGPLLTRADDGQVVAAGILSKGAIACNGGDAYERLDVALVRDWLAERVGAPNTTASACDTLGHTGRCFDGIAVWCGDAVEHGERCTGGSECAWSAESSGFRCLSETHDPCGGISELGDCVAARARRCVDGVLEELDCSACGSTCVVSPSDGRSYCIQ